MGAKPIPNNPSDRTSDDWKRIQRRNYFRSLLKMRRENMAPTKSKKAPVQADIKAGQALLTELANLRAENKALKRSNEALDREVKALEKKAKARG
jgi:cell division protein FtsB